MTFGSHPGTFLAKYPFYFIIPVAQLHLQYVQWCGLFSPLPTFPSSTTTTVFPLSKQLYANRKPGNPRSYYDHIC